MKKLVILLLIPIISFSQEKNKSKVLNDIAGYSLCFVSGLAQGVEETISHHYKLGFERVHPNANAQFWNPKLSWVNKNKNEISKLIPTLSDGYHLTRGVSRISMIGAIAISANDFKGKNKVWRVAKKFLISMAFNRAGQYLTYDVIYKQEL